MDFIRKFKFNNSASLSTEKRSYFLFGPRGVGKSSYLKKEFKDKSLFIDLLKSETYLSLASNPSNLEMIINKKKESDIVIIDEVQKLPAILDEVHRLIEDKNIQFILSGSSSRKLKKAGANLLGGRAISKIMLPLSFTEIGDQYNLEDALEFGNLPLVVKYKESRKDTLSTYLDTYLKEEIKQEGLVRQVEPFIRFLEVASIVNGEQINLSNIAREAKVKRPTLDTYLSILEDTLVVSILKPYKPRIKVREDSHPKLYWFDTGVVRAGMHYLDYQPSTDWLGKALESTVLHELKCYFNFQNIKKNVFFYKSNSNFEIDFIIELNHPYERKKPELIAIEVKHGKRYKSEWLHNLKSFVKEDKLEVKKAYLLYNGEEEMRSNEGIEIINVLSFFRKLHNGEIL